MTHFSLATIFVNLMHIKWSTVLHTSPQTIGLFTLVASIQQAHAAQNFALGIYEKSGRRMFGKTWTGRKSYSSLSLHNEAHMYSLLRPIAARLSKHARKQLTQVHIPESLGLFEHGKTKTLLVEHVNATALSSRSAATQMKMYDKSVSFVRALGRIMNKSERAQVAKRNVFSEVMLFPFIFLGALATYPEHWRLFIESIPLFLKSLKDLLFSKTDTLTHRDLHLGNILVKGSDAWLIDFENMVFTFPEYEFVVTLISHWDNIPLRKHLLRKLSEMNKTVAAALIVKQSIHYLNNAQVPPYFTRNCIAALRYTIQKN